MNLSVHIERLILRDLPLQAGGGELVQAALEAELSRLLAEGGLAAGLQGGGALPSLPALNIQLPAQAEPAQVGVQIAQAVYGGLGAR